MPKMWAMIRIFAYWRYTGVCYNFLASFLEILKLLSFQPDQIFWLNVFIFIMTCTLQLYFNLFIFFILSLTQIRIFSRQCRLFYFFSVVFHKNSFLEWKKKRRRFQVLVFSTATFFLFFFFVSYVFWIIYKAFELQGEYHENGREVLQ